MLQNSPEGTKDPNLTPAREAARITLDRVKSWEELNAAILAEADEKFAEATRKYWTEFAVHGILQFDPETKQRILKPFTDLDGQAALGILSLAGIDTSNLTYVEPGRSLKGAINIDTGDKFGVVYDEETYTAWFDHHGKGNKVTSATEIVYRTLLDLKIIESSETLERIVDFVNKIDNRQFEPEEFLRSSRTILGLQKDLTFDVLIKYFADHKDPTDELTDEELEKYGLKQASEKQETFVDEAMQKLEEMEKAGKVVETEYGSIVINENNELRAGSSAAYVRHNGIINFTPGKSFAVTLKKGELNEEKIRGHLGGKFQGKIIRGKIWIYNEDAPLNLSLEEIISALGGKK